MMIRKLAAATVLAGLVAAPAWSQVPAEPPAAPDPSVFNTEAANDPAANLQDLYAFIDPQDPDRLVVILTFQPFAARNAQFVDDVAYDIHIDAVDGGQLVITCSFEADGNIVTCSDEQGLFNARGSIESTITGDNLDLFAGLRENPTFFDTAAFTESFRSGTLAFTDPGTDTFADSNVQTLALSIPIDQLTAGGTTPVLRVWAASERTGGDGVSAGHTGAWFNPDNPGHGVFMHVTPGPAGDDGEPQGQQLVVSWLVFDNDGNPLYLVGVGDIDGNQVSVPLMTQTGGSFPPGTAGGEAVEQIDFGVAEFTFDDCNHATMAVTPTVAGFAPVSIDLQRLTTVADLECTFHKAGQVARVGRPGVRSMLVDPANEQGLQDDFNQTADLDELRTTFEPVIQQNLDRLDALDGVIGNTALPTAELAAMFADDRLTIDTRAAVCDDLLAVELGMQGLCGGRTLERDAYDDLLSATVGPDVSDNVVFDRNPIDAFPWLGTPRGFREID